jgi:hypothetical protein
MGQRGKTERAFVSRLLVMGGLAAACAFAAETVNGPEGAAAARESVSKAPTFSVQGDSVRFGLVTVNAAKREATFPARVHMTNALIEYAVVTEYGNVHESLLVTDAKPTDVQSALLLLDVRPTGTNGFGLPLGAVPLRSAAQLEIAWERNGRRHTAPLHEWIALTDGQGGSVTGALAPGPWLFNGSMFTEEGFAAHFSGSIVSLITDPAAIINNPRPDREDDEIHTPAAAVMPPLGTPVTVRIAAQRAP